MKRTFLSTLTLAMALTFTAQAQELAHDKEILGAPGQRLEFRGPLFVPEVAVTRGGLVRDDVMLGTLYMKRGQMQFDNRTSRETLMKSFRTFLIEQKENFCELTVTMKVGSNNLVMASLRLEHVSQGINSNWLDTHAIHRSLADSTKFSPSNEVIGVRCTVFVTNENPQITVGDLTQAIGPVAYVTQEKKLTVDPRQALGTGGPYLTFRNRLFVPLRALPDWVQDKPSGKIRAASFFMANGNVLIDSRTPAEKNQKSFGIYLIEQKQDFCELTIIPELNTIAALPVEADLRLLRAQMSVFSDYESWALTSIRVTQDYFHEFEHYNQSFAQKNPPNRVTSVMCTHFYKFVSRNSMKTSIPTSVLLKAVGPLAEIKFRNF